MTLYEINQRCDDLRYTRYCIEQAMKKFEGTNKVENYLGYESLKIAHECVVTEMDRFINRNWT